MPEFNFDMGQMIIVIVGVIIFFLVIFFVVRSSRRWVIKNLARRRHDLDRGEMQQRWQRIEAMIKSADPEVDRLAVIEANNLLDFVLKAMHLPGQTMIHRLRFAQNKYWELKRLRWAHNLRNKLVHEPDFHLAKRQARAAVHEYERALKLLGAL